MSAPPLFLVGFMAAGKTSVGRAIAHAAGRQFIDLDDVIAARAGEPVAVLVARDEPAFRAREAAALSEVIAASGAGPVVATGGGAAAHGDNLARMRAAGLVVALGVDVREAEARAAGGPPRPLLADAARLHASRAASYRRAHAVVDTTGRTLDEVVRDVGAVARARLRLPADRRDATILALGERSYPVTIDDGAFDEPGEATGGGGPAGFARGAGGSAPRGIDESLVRAHLPGVTRLAIVTDRTVAGHWLEPARRALGAAEVVEIEPGEASKSFAGYQQLAEQLVARGLDRGSAIIALGGGVVGDLAGFVAATLFRGIAVVQVPTTLVAMTDAAIGGKTAIDLPAGKNLVGAFWQPRLVACGLATLQTLPARERRAGFGELWKYALLDGPAMWRAVDACTGWATAGGAPPPALREVIERAIAYKAAIVGRDERERTGQRALLNLGHTVGHAIEAEAGLHHGEAVGLGLVAACRVSAALGRCDPQLEAEVVAALRRTGLPADLDPYLRDAVLDRIRVDKKRTADRVRFLVVGEVGSCEPYDIGAGELGRILRSTSRS